VVDFEKMGWRIGTERIPKALKMNLLQEVQGVA
jgi:hypothetical protein